jgi:hypothetical protein
MVAEVCVGRVGAVAALEVSRFARNSRDWQRLVEVCRVVHTLLIDQEAVYSLRQGNDRPDPLSLRSRVGARRRPITRATTGGHPSRPPTSPHAAPITPVCIRLPKSAI